MADSTSPIDGPARGGVSTLCAGPFFMSCFNVQFNAFHRKFDKKISFGATHFLS
jgi:hypothetical protein